ncbi:MAG TPA: fibronectin type III domain-containing protein, partial [Vicinamibacterales bacterium]
MRFRRGSAVMVIAALVALPLSACGKKGPPQPPLRRSPARVTDAEARRVADRIELRFTVPATNSDGSTPPTVQRVEVYRLTLPAAAPAPTIAQVTASSNLKSTVEVRPPAEEGAPPPAKPDPRPGPGEVATVVDKLEGDKVGTADAPVAHYVVVGLTGRRRGPTSPIVSVPLGPLPSAPTNLQPTHDEKTLTLTWTPAAPDQRFRVYLVPDQARPDERKLLTAEPLATATFALPVELGKQQCFTVTAVAAAGKTTVEGPGLGPACVTAEDRFPPPAPEGLRGNQTGTSTVVLLDWRAVDVPDLGGYIVLRSDGTSDTLQPLTREPIAETSYEDKTVQAGLTYTYAVVAVDRSTPRNQSPQSNRHTVQIR